MLGKAKKRINKILVFVLNLLLMAIAILLIKEKDQARLSEKKQNDLLIDKASLSEENAVLKSELQSFKGILEGNELVLTEEEKNAEIPKAATQAPDSAASTTAPITTNKSTPADTAGKKPSSSSAASSKSGSVTSPSPAKKAPSSNSKTKTS